MSERNSISSSLHEAWAFYEYEDMIPVVFSNSHSRSTPMVRSDVKKTRLHSQFEHFERKLFRFENIEVVLTSMSSEHNCECTMQIFAEDVFLFTPFLKQHELAL